MHNKLKCLVAKPTAKKQIVVTITNLQKNQKLKAIAKAVALIALSPPQLIFSLSSIIIIQKATISILNIHRALSTKTLTFSNSYIRFGNRPK